MTTPLSVRITNFFNFPDMATSTVSRWKHPFVRRHVDRAATMYGRMDRLDDSDEIYKLFRHAGVRGIEKVLAAELGKTAPHTQAAKKAIASLILRRVGEYSSAGRWVLMAGNGMVGRSQALRLLETGRPIVPVYENVDTRRHEYRSAVPNGYDLHVRFERTRNFNHSVDGSGTVIDSFEKLIHWYTKEACTWLRNLDLREQI